MTLGEKETLEVREEVVPEPEKVAEIAEVQPQTKTYTQEELDVYLIEKEKAYKGLQNVISKKDQEIQKLRQKPAVAQTEDDSNLFEVLLQDRKKKADELGETDPLIAVMETELAKRKYSQKQAQIRAQQEAFASDWKGKLEEKIAKAGLDPNSEEFDDVWESFDMTFSLDGKFDRVDKKADRIINRLKPKAEAKPNTHNEEEKARQQKLKEEGKLKTDLGIPSGVSIGVKEAMARFARGEISEAEASRLGVKFT